MSPPSPLYRRAWIVVPLLALSFLFWCQSLRKQRVEHVTTVVPSEAVVSATSPSGYVGGVRNLIIPQQNADSFQWIAQTQQMLATGEWRVRRIDYEDAPAGREIHTPSPYRWWLGLIAHLDHDLSGRPLGVSVERAALIADPLLQVLLFIVAVGFTAWRFGAWPAAVLGVAIVALFPFATAFISGIPDDKTLSRACSLLSLLTLFAGVQSAHSVGGAAGGRRVSPRWFFAAGMLNAFGLWISVADHFPTVLGIALGGLLAAWVDRSTNSPGFLSSRDWLWWAVAGSACSLFFYFVEYFPTHLGSWRLHLIHPVYSISWIGLGATLAIATAHNQDGSSHWSRRTVALAVVAVGALGVLPVLMSKLDSAAFLASDLWSLRLSRLPGSAEAANLWVLLTTGGSSALLLAALLPALIVAPAAWLLARPGTSAVARTSLAVGLGPVVIALVAAGWQIGRWSGFDAVLLALLIPVTVALGEPGGVRFTQWIWAACVGLLLLPGAIRLLPPPATSEKNPLSETELAALISRDLAHWLVKHSGPDRLVVLAPPDETMALSYYGGLRGIGTLSWENHAGIGAAVRVFGAITPQEAHARVQQREITHIVVPSWNRYLDEYFRVSGVKVEDAFLSGLRNWAPIPWLRPLPYQLPAVSGYEAQLVSVFAVVEEQNEATTLSWQADYFTEMGQLEYAAALSQALERFPADLGALITRAQVAMARQDGAALANALKLLTPRLSAGADRNLSWDRRAALAAVLAQGKQTDLAREQVRRCLADASEKRLRSVSTGSLYRLLLLAKAFELDWNDPELRALALDLLPPDWRNRI